jgi:hypothetical protein
MRRRGAALRPVWVHWHVRRAVAAERFPLTLPTHALPDLVAGLHPSAGADFSH